MSLKRHNRIYRDYSTVASQAYQHVSNLQTSLYGKPTRQKLSTPSHIPLQVP